MSTEDKIKDSHALLDKAIQDIKDDDKQIAAIGILFSGGNDSTILAHMFKDRATHTIHANTGIGIEQTREYVRNISKEWGLPLVEKRPLSNAGYRELCLGQVKAISGKNKGKVSWGGGFPGPAAHWLMYRRLKERCLEQARNELITHSRRERVIFLAGRRAEESKRRKFLAGKSPIERKGSIVWVSPLIHYTDEDMRNYRNLYPDTPRNEVSDLLHMSGECLCGAFAHPGELDEIGFWFPSVRKEIEELEEEVSKMETIPDQRKKWGWGATKDGKRCQRCE